MLRKILLLLIVSLVRPTPGIAAYYRLSERAVVMYEQILQLDLGGAIATSLVIKEKEPDNLVVHHLENYADFFRLYLTEDEDLLEELLPRRAARLAALEELADDDPWRRYALAEIRLHWAMIRLRFESYYPAFRDVNKAHKLLRENAERFPDFLPTYKDLGLLHAAVGAVPPQFKWGLELFSSLSGDVARGSREMERALAATDHPFYRETAVLYALMCLHLRGEPETAWQIVSDLGLRPATNKLHCFVLANVAMRSGRNEPALRWLSRQPRNRDHLDFPYLDFMLGLAKIRDLDYGAGLYFQSFLSRFRGRHFVKEAIQKIAWCELLRNRPEAYRERLATLGHRGNTTNGGDANADGEARAGRLPHLGLLRARLLFDGAYFQRARNELDGIEPRSLTPTQQLEYTYRTGRVLHGLQDWNAALAFYERTIMEGAEAESFFACNAALQAGLIHEKLLQPQRAIKYFQRCLDLNPREYRTGLHIQAKAGINRLRR